MSTIEQHVIEEIPESVVGPSRRWVSCMAFHTRATSERRFTWWQVSAPVRRRRRAEVMAAQIRQMLSVVPASLLAPHVPVVEVRQIGEAAHWFAVWVRLTDGSDMELPDA